MIVRDIEELVARDDMLWMMGGWEACGCECECGAGERGKREIEIERGRERYPSDYGLD